MTPDLAPLPESGAVPWRDRLARRLGRGEAQRGRTAFVLAGGGSRGAVQVGMLAALVDRGIRADRVYGASVGAVNGAAYCGDPTPAGMLELERVWRSLSGDLVFPRRRGHGPWTYFQQRSAVHANSGLRRILEEGVRFERLEDAEIPLQVVATSLVDGRECWLDRGPTIEAVLASAAIPAMFPPVTIGGELLIDGGVVNNVPISRAIEDGARTIYVLLCGPLHFSPRPARRPVEAVLTAFFVAVHARFARELAALPPGVEVVVISGGGDPTADYRDFSGAGELIAGGRAEVDRVLEARAAANERVGNGRATGSRRGGPAQRPDEPRPAPPGGASATSGPGPSGAPPARTETSTSGPPPAGTGPARLSRPAGGMGRR